MFLEQLYFAFKRIKNRLLESVVVIISLGFGLAIVSSVIGILVLFNQETRNAGNNNRYNRQININPSQWGHNSFYEMGITKIGNRDMGEMVEFSLEDIELIKNSCPSIDYGLIEEWFAILQPEEYTDEIVGNWWETQIYGLGINEDHVNFLGLELEYGSTFSIEDYENGNRVVILGGSIKKNLFGDKNPVGEILTYNNIDYTIIGSYKEDYKDADNAQIEEMKGRPWGENNYFYAPFTMVLNEQNRKINRITLGVDDYEKLLAAVEEVKLYISVNYPDGALTVSSSLDWNKDMQEKAKLALTIFAFVAFICLLIAALTNLNLMLARVLRDKKSLGISVALGATRANLFSSVIIESGIMGLLGGILGLTLTTLFTLALGVLLKDMGSIASATLSPATFIITIALALLVTGILSLFPAIEAKKVSPSMVLRED